MRLNSNVKLVNHLSLFLQRIICLEVPLVKLLTKLFYVLILVELKVVQAHEEVSLC